jgi:hypothetical protein
MGFVVHIARPGRAAVGLCFGSESEASDFLAYVRAANASHPSIIGNSRLGVVRPDLNPDSPPLCAVDDRLSPGCTGAAKMLLDRAQRCNVARQRLPRHRCADPPFEPLWIILAPAGQPDLYEDSSAIGFQKIREQRRETTRLSFLTQSARHRALYGRQRVDRAQGQPREH